MTSDSPAEVCPKRPDAPGVWIELDTGKPFLAYDPPDDWTVFDVAVDQVRGGLWYEDGNEDPIETGSGSVEEERHYCARCTRKRDTKPEGVVGG